jgi:RNA polymerase sigma-70 factor (ECF subfamily)
MDTNLSSYGLVRRVKAGDRFALERLILRYLPRLRRWARRRLPPWARDLAETEDLVQDTLFNAVRNLPTFEMRQPYALRAYMKQALKNRVQDEIKRAHRHPPGDALSAVMRSDLPSPADRVLSREDLWRCRAALARLRPTDRKIILVVLGEDVSSRELADRINMPSADAARMALNRAVRRLAREMERLDS